MAKQEQSSEERRKSASALWNVMKTGNSEMFAALLNRCSTKDRVELLVCALISADEERCSTKLAAVTSREKAPITLVLDPKRCACQGHECEGDALVWEDDSAHTFGKCVVVA